MDLESGATLETQMGTSHSVDDRRKKRDRSTESVEQTAVRVEPVVLLVGAATSIDDCSSALHQEAVDEIENDRSTRPISIKQQVIGGQLACRRAEAHSHHAGEGGELNDENEARPSKKMKKLDALHRNSSSPGASSSFALTPRTDASEHFFGDQPSGSGIASASNSEDGDEVSEDQPQRYDEELPSTLLNEASLFPPTTTTKNKEKERRTPPPPSQGNDLSLPGGRPPDASRKNDFEGDGVSPPRNDDQDELDAAAGPPVVPVGPPPTVGTSTTAAGASPPTSSSPPPTRTASGNETSAAVMESTADTTVVDHHVVRRREGPPAPEDSKKKNSQALDDGGSSLGVGMNPGNKKEQASLPPSSPPAPTAAVPKESPENPSSSTQVVSRQHRDAIFCASLPTTSSRSTATKSEEEEEDAPSVAATLVTADAAARKAEGDEVLFVPRKELPAHLKSDALLPPPLAVLSTNKSPPAPIMVDSAHRTLTESPEQTTPGPAPGIEMKNAGGDREEEEDSISSHDSSYALTNHNTGAEDLQRALPIINKDEKDERENVSNTSIILVPPTIAATQSQLKEDVEDDKYPLSTPASRQHDPSSATESNRYNTVTTKVPCFSSQHSGRATNVVVSKSATMKDASRDYSAVVDGISNLSPIDKKGDGGGIIIPDEDAARLLNGGNQALPPRSSPSDDSASSGSNDSETSDFECPSPTFGSLPEEDEHMVLEPSDDDVLCGRKGSKFFQHPGNKRMLHIVEQKEPCHKVARKVETTEIVSEVTREIEDLGSRSTKVFQSEDGERNGWMEVSPHVKYKTVLSSCLRADARRNDDSDSSSSKYLPGPSASPKSESLEAATSQQETSQSSGKRRAVNLPPSSRSKTKIRGIKKSLTNEASLSRATQEGFQKSMVKPPTSKKTDSHERGARPERAAIMKRDSSTSTESEDSVEKPSAKRNELDILGMAALMKTEQNDNVLARTLPHLNASRFSSGSQSSSSISGDPTARRNELSQYLPATATIYQQQNDRLIQEPGPPSSAQARGNDATSVMERYGIVLGDPTASDVLFGQDPAFYTHAGNIQLRRLVEGSIQGYPGISLDTKLLLSRRIVAEMKYTGTRFLTRQRISPPGLWYRVDDMEVESLIFRLLEEEEARVLSSLPTVHRTTSSTDRMQNPIAFPITGQKASGAGRSLEISIERESGATRVPPDTAASFLEAAGKSVDSSASSNPASPKTGSDVRDGEGLASDAKSGLPSSPGPHDVICGRGRGNFRHPGNRRMLRMFWEMKDQYSIATKLQKTTIGRAIVEDIKSKGGRFLIQKGNGWEEVERQTVLRKVCHGIRDIPNDPEKRKRSIVANELGNPLNPPSPIMTSVGTSWVASNATKKKKYKKETFQVAGGISSRPPSAYTKESAETAKKHPILRIDKRPKKIRRQQPPLSEVHTPQPDLRRKKLETQQNQLGPHDIQRSEPPKQPRQQMKEADEALLNKKQSEPQRKTKQLEVPPRKALELHSKQPQQAVRNLPVAPQELNQLETSRKRPPQSEKKQSAKIQIPLLAAKGWIGVADGACDTSRRKDAAEGTKASSFPPADPLERRPDEVAKAAGGTEIIETPTENDVLLGRGKGFFQHHGNRRMLQIISESTSQYKSSSKMGKSRVVRDVYTKVQGNGARFLKRIDGSTVTGWGVVSPNEALQKVSHGIRDYMASLSGVPQERRRSKKLQRALSSAAATATATATDSTITSKKNPRRFSDESNNKSAPILPNPNLRRSEENRTTTDTTRSTAEQHDKHEAELYRHRASSQQAAAGAVVAPDRATSSYTGRAMMHSANYGAAYEAQGLLAGPGEVFLPRDRGSPPAAISTTRALLGDHVGGIPLHVLMALRQQQQQQTEAFLAGTGGRSRLSPDEQLLLFGGNASFLTPQEQLLILRQRELQATRRRFGM